MLQISLTVEHAAIVERYCHTHIVERGRVAEHIVDGIGLCMYDVGIAEKLAGCGSMTCAENIVIGIDTGYHCFSQTVGEHMHEHGFLAPFQAAHLVGEHDFKIALGRFQLLQHCSPEEHIVIALNVGNNALSG